MKLPKTDALEGPRPEDGPLVDWFEHRLDRDWREASRKMNEVKALAIRDTLDHLIDLETMCERDGLEEIAAEIRNLASRLRGLQKDYDHAAVAGA